MKIMAEKFFLTVEWAVENFSCWHRKIHGKKIASPKFEAAFDLLALTLELYPRGFTGRGENVAVRVRYKSNSDLSGDFFLVTGGSSPLWAHELKAEEGEGVLELSSSGPKFEDLADKMEEEDRLTLKCRVEWDYDDEVHRTRTEIDAFDSVWRMSPGTFLNFESDDGDLKTLATIRYPLDDDEGSGEMSLLVFPLKDSRFELALEPEHRRGRFSNVAVSTRLVVRQGRSVVRREHKDHLFVDRKRWTPLSLTSDEVTDEGFGAVLCIRVVPSNRCKHRNVCVFAPKDVAEASRDHSFRSCFDEEERGQADGADNSVLSGDLRCLYRDRDFSDFLIKCDGVSFPVHRAILSARSPVFKTMLSSDMTEASSGSMDIKDIDPSTLSPFLTYLYTGTVEDSLNCDSAPKLYYAADKYQVHSLKRECADFLSADLSVSNVCDVLSVADRHRDEGVRSAAHDFVLENYNAVLTSPEWEGFQEGEPLLAVRTLTSVSVRRGGS